VVGLIGELGLMPCSDIEHRIELAGQVANLGGAPRVRVQCRPSPTGSHHGAGHGPQRACDSAVDDPHRERQDQQREQPDQRLPRERATCIGEHGGAPDTGVDAQ
jgi:hypothetical protein